MIIVCRICLEKSYSGIHYLLYIRKLSVFFLAVIKLLYFVSISKLCELIKEGVELLIIAEIDSGFFIIYILFSYLHLFSKFCTKIFFKLMTFSTIVSFHSCFFVLGNFHAHDIHTLHTCPGVIPHSYTWATFHIWRECVSVCITYESCSVPSSLYVATT